MGQTKYVLWQVDNSHDEVPKSKRRKRQKGLYVKKKDAEARREELMKERKLEPADLVIKRVK